MHTNDSAAISSRLKFLFDAITEFRSRDALEQPAPSALFLLETAESFCTLLSAAAESHVPTTLADLLCALRISAQLLCALNDESARKRQLRGARALEKSAELFTCGGVAALAAILFAQKNFCCYVFSPGRRSVVSGNDLSFRPKRTEIEEKREKEKKRERQGESEKEKENENGEKGKGNENGNEEEESLREAFLSVLRALIFPAAQSYEQQKHKCREFDLRFRCAAALAQNRFLFDRRAAEAFLSRDGQTFQRFLISLLNDTFSEMRSLCASGKQAPMLFSSSSSSLSLSFSSNAAARPPLLPLSFAPHSFAFYVPVISQSENERMRISHFSRAHHFSPPPQKQKDKDKENPQSVCESEPCEMARMECVCGAALCWAFAVIAALSSGDANISRLSFCDGAAFAHSNDLPCGETSDFVNFIGDLVGVCSVVIYPFLTEQKERMRRLQRFAHMSMAKDNASSSSSSSLSLSFSSSSISSLSLSFAQLAHDAAQCVSCGSATAQFLQKFDRQKKVLPRAVSAGRKQKDNARESPQKKITENRPKDKSAEFRPNKKNDKKDSGGGANDFSAKKCAGASADSAERNTNHKNKEEKAKEKEKEREGKELDLVPWKEVAALFAELKRRREAERAAQFGEWKKLRQKNAEIARRVLCARSGRDALREILPRELTNSPRGRNVWTAQLRRRVAELEGEVRNCL